MEDEVRVAINTDADLVTARAEGRAMAERLGFPRPDPTLIATAISEVARNIVVHVGRGEIVLRPFEDADRYGLVVIASDDGPGIRDVDAAAPRRLQRQGRPRPRPARSAAPHGRLRGRVGRRHRHDRDDEEVEVPRRARAPARGAPPPCLSERRGNRSSGASPTRCRRGEATSGDLAVVTLLPEGALVAAIDGLGHGDEAARAARTAAEVVRESPSQDLVLLVERCHGALQGTRGAAISLAFVSAAEERDDLARRRQRGGTRAERRSVGEAAEGLSRARERRSRARAAAA